MVNHSVALWLTSDAPGAQVVDEVSHVVFDIDFVWKEKTMDPQFLLTQQIQANAAAIEQNLSVLYNPEVPYEHKKVALSYVYVQTQQIEALVKGLYSQFEDIGNHTYRG